LSTGSRVGPAVGLPGPGCQRGLAALRNWHSPGGRRRLSHTARNASVLPGGVFQLGEHARPSRLLRVSADGGAATRLYIQRRPGQEDQGEQRLEPGVHRSIIDPAIASANGTRSQAHEPDRPRLSNALARSSHGVFPDGKASPRQ
jgi:hypothetical protein